MPSSRLVWILLAAALASSGCHQSAPLPPVDQIAKVRLTVTRLPGEAAAKTPRNAILTEPPDIAEVIDWLKQIDWSQHGTDLTVVGMPQPDGHIEIITRNGDSSDFAFYWDGGFINVKANRRIRGGDMAKLRQIVERVCK